MKRVFLSLLALVVLATVGYFIGSSKKSTDTDVPTDTHAAAEVDSVRIYNIVDEMPRQLNNITIPYPKDALDAGMGGIVHIKMIIDSGGNVEDAELHIGSGVPSLDQAALDAARRLKFTPAIVDGMPVRMRLFKPFTFDVNNVERVIG